MSMQTISANYLFKLKYFLYSMCILGCMAYDVNEERLALSYGTQMDLGQCVSRCNMTRYVAVMVGSPSRLQRVTLMIK